MSSALVWVAFVVLAVTAWCREADRPRKTLRDWGLDASGLLMQGIVVPLLQATAIYALLVKYLPDWHGSWHLASWQAFLLNFVGVDYLYYWNHRLLHGPRLWRWHAVHHTLEDLDVFGTARNTLWTPFLLVYIWVNALAVFLINDPAAYLWAAALTAGLDLWRHSDIFPASTPRLHRALASILITPLEHAWHHSMDRTNCNYGANLSWWDRLHGTYWLGQEEPSKLGVSLNWPFLQRFLFPLSATEALADPPSRSGGKERSRDSA